MGRHVYDSVYFVFFDPSETRERERSSPLLSAAVIKAMPNGLTE